MGKAEQFIREHTRGCSNIIKVNTVYGAIEDKEPWITPDQARRAVEIAREELTEKVCQWIKENANNYIEIKEGTLQYKRSLTTDLKKNILKQ